MSIFSLLLLLLLSVDLLSAEFAAVRNSALSKLTASSFYVSLHTKYITLKNTHTHTHTHPFNIPFSGTTRESRYQKGKTNPDFTEARASHTEETKAKTKNRTTHTA